METRKNNLASRIFDETPLTLNENFTIWFKITFNKNLVSQSRVVSSEEIEKLIGRKVKKEFKIGRFQDRLLRAHCGSNYYKNESKNWFNQIEKESKIIWEIMETRKNNLAARIFDETPLTLNEKFSIWFKITLSDEKLVSYSRFVNTEDIENYDYFMVRDKSLSKLSYNGRSEGLN